MNENEEKTNWCKEILEQLDNEINTIKDESISKENIDYLYRLVDIHKDIKNEEYWKEKINMKYRYGNYNDYNDYGENEYGRRGVPGTSRGRYNESGSYGRRGVPGSGRGRYRGEDMLDEMYESYGEYMDSGNYGGQETTKALKYMLKSAEDFFKHIQEEAQSPEEIELVKKSARRISEM